MAVHPPLPFVARIAVPDETRSLPSGFSRFRLSLDRGLPATLALAQNTEAVAMIGGGIMRRWQTTAALELVHSASLEDADAAMPVRLLLRREHKRLGSIPLRPGPVQIVGSRKAGYLAIKLIDWSIYAGTVLGPGDFGSFIELAWRFSNERPAEFTLPPVRTGVLRRLANSPRPWFDDDPRLTEAAQDGPTRDEDDPSRNWRGYGWRFGDG